MGKPLSNPYIRELAPEIEQQWKPGEEGEQKFSISIMKTYANNKQLIQSAIH